VSGRVRAGRVGEDSSHNPAGPRPSALTHNTPTVLLADSLVRAMASGYARGKGAKSPSGDCAQMRACQRRVD